MVERTAALTEAERRSAAGEQRLRTIADNLPVLISYIDRDERLQFLNATFGAWTGVPVAQAIGTPAAAGHRPTALWAVPCATPAGHGRPARGVRGALAIPGFVARKIIAAVNRPFELPGLALDISTSIGIAFQADARIHAAALLAAADKALYEAKGGGRNTFRTASA